MEARRLISFGSSSYVVSIPKRWVNKNGLNKGDFVYFTENGSNELIFTPQQKEIKKELRSITLNTGTKSFQEIRREFLSYYIGGYDVIRLQSKSNLKNPEEIRDTIRDITTMDIVEQNNNVIVAKDFLNVEKISVEDSTRRADLIIRSMIEDSKYMKNKSKFTKVYNMDTEVNRITFMMFRFIKKALNDTKLANAFSHSPESLLSLWLLASNLEKIADDAKRIARLLKTADLKKEEFDAIIGLYSTIEKEYLNAMKSYYNKNKEMALKVADNKDKIIEICNDFVARYDKSVIGGIVERLKSMEVYIVSLVRSIYDE